MELYKLHQLEAWWRRRGLLWSLPSFLLFGLSSLTNFHALSSWPRCTCVGPAGLSMEALGGSPGPRWKEGRQEVLGEGGTEDVKAAWGSGEGVQGDCYSKGRQRGEWRLLGVLLVLLLTKSPSLTCERNVKV